MPRDQPRRRPSSALAMSIAAMAVAIGGTAIVAQAGGGGDATKIVGYAEVRANGSVVASRSNDVSSSNVNSLDNGVYCFKGIDGVRGGQVTSDYPSSSTTMVSQFGLGAGSGCPDNTKFYVSNADAGPSGGFPEGGFFILLYR